MSESRAHFELKSEYLNGSLFVENQLRKGIGFEIWYRICAQNLISLLGKIIIAFVNVCTTNVYRNF